MKFKVRLSCGMRIPHHNFPFILMIAHFCVPNFQTQKCTGYFFKRSLWCGILKPHHFAPPQLKTSSLHGFDSTCNFSKAPHFPLVQNVIEQLACTNVTLHLGPYVVHQAANLQEFDHAIEVPLRQLLAGFVNLDFCYLNTFNRIRMNQIGCWKNQCRPFVWKAHSFQPSSQSHPLPDRPTTPLHQRWQSGQGSWWR